MTNYNPCCVVFFIFLFILKHYSLVSVLLKLFVTPIHAETTPHVTVFSTKMEPSIFVRNKRYEASTFKFSVFAFVQLI